MFKVIEGIKKEKPDYFRIYTDAFLATLQRAIEAKKAVIDMELIEVKRLVYYGIKMINAQNEKDLNYEELIARHERMKFIIQVIGILTPNEFENIFPIEKKYDGDRYQCKDYYYTAKVLDDIGREVKISSKVDDLLWDYTNWEVREFNVNYLSSISDIRRAEGQKGIMEEWLEEKGITPYYLRERENGKKYLQNGDTGEVVEVKKPIPRYLRLVQNEKSPS